MVISRYLGTSDVDEDNEVLVSDTVSPTTVWRAPHTSDAIRAKVDIPGSKSLTNRYLVLAALSDADTELLGVLTSRDSVLMIEALRCLGARFEAPDGDTTRLRVSPLRRNATYDEPITIDCGLAGTVMRFVPPVAALLNVEVRFDGDLHARRRPMTAIIDGLSQAGADISANNGTIIPEFLPFKLHGHGDLAGGCIDIDASGSSQFISALLLVGALCDDGVQIRHTGSNTPSPEHIAMTIDVLAKAGVTVEQPSMDQWNVAPGVIRAGHDTGRRISIEPDLSNAGPYLAAAVVTGGEISIANWPRSTTQIGNRWREILPRFGADVHFTPVPGTDYGNLTVTGPSSGNFTGGGDIIDTAELAPTVAALALLADGPTRLSGIGHLRGHETDRLHAITTEAAALGANVTEGEDFLEFTGNYTLRPAHLHAYDDHRMATFAAILGLGVSGITLDDVATTSKTMPNFARAWAELVQAGATNPNRVVTA